MLHGKKETCFTGVDVHSKGCRESPQVYDLPVDTYGKKTLESGISLCLAWDVNIWKKSGRDDEQTELVIER